MSNVASTTRVARLALNEEQLRSAALAYMSSNPLSPDDLVEQASILELKFRYAPIYLLHVNFQASWTASFGYNYQHEYTEHVENFENGRLKKRRETRTRTETRWQPASGTESGSFTIRVAANSSSSPAESDIACTATVSSWQDGLTDDRECVDVDPVMLSIDAAKRTKGHDEAQNIIEKRVKAHAQGDHQKDWHWSSNLAIDGELVYIPVGYCLFQYSGSNYAVYVDGCDPTRIKGDALPVDKGKTAQLNYGYAPLLGAVIGAVSALFINGAAQFSYLVAFSVVAASYAYAHVRKRSMLKYHSRRKALILARFTERASDAFGRAGQEAVEPLAPALFDPVRERRVLPVLTCVVFLVALFGPAQSATQPSTPAQSSGSNNQVNVATASSANASNNASTGAGAPSPSSEQESGQPQASSNSTVRASDGDSFQ